MPSLTNEQQQLLDLLTVEYKAIYAIEEILNFRISQRDSRLRIDYFFDAPRAMTNEELPLEYRRQRLAVEWLAYDAAAIRYLEHRPFVALIPNDQHYSASLSLIVTDKTLPNTSRNPDREDKRLLKHHYLRFGVLFVALFKPFADRDYRDKQEEMQEQLSTLNELEKNIEALALGSGNKQEIAQLLAMVDDPKLKSQLKALLADKRYQEPQAMREAMNVAATGVQAQGSSLKGMEDAHLAFLSAQLGLYEQGKQMVQQLARQGINLAGQHLDQTMGQSTDLGRGR